MSYLEWVQNIQNVHWDRRHVEDELERRLTGAHLAVVERSRLDECTLREAAFRVAVERVSEAERLRGHM